MEYMIKIDGKKVKGTLKSKGNDRLGEFYIFEELPSQRVREVFYINGKTKPKKEIKEKTLKQIEEEILSNSVKEETILNKVLKNVRKTKSKRK